MADSMVHRGGCHCKRVRWQVLAPSNVIVWDCNCSNCDMRRNRHFIVPSSNFKLEEGSEQWLTTYTFGTKQAQHIFCKVCGITSYYIPRSNPDGVAVTFGCVDSGTIEILEIREFDGKNWENFYGSSGIAKFSKNEDDK